MEIEGVINRRKAVLTIDRRAKYSKFQTVFDWLEEKDDLSETPGKSEFL